MDAYIVKIYWGKWLKVQAETQFQGEGSSHELASIALTETISYSLEIKKTPLFVLLCDFQSAFDKVLPQHVVKCAYLAGTQDEALKYIDLRL